MNSALVEAALAEVTLAFVVFCADSVGDEHPLGERLTRAVLWMMTLTVWLTHRRVAKLSRFGGVVWFLVTAGWLLSLEYDRLSPGAFLLVAPATMAFVVYCVDGLSADLENKPGRRLLRSLLWIGPLIDYFTADDSVALVTASVTVWLLLTTGWLLGLVTDRIAGPLGG